MKHTLTLVTLLSLGVTVAEGQTLEKSNPPALSKPAPGTYTHVIPRHTGKEVFLDEDFVMLAGVTNKLLDASLRVP